MASTAPATTIFCTSSTVEIDHPGTYGLGRTLTADLPEDTLQGALELGSLISAIGIELEQEWEPAEQGCHPQNAAIES